jgi:hypothetical protein
VATGRAAYPHRAVGPRQAAALVPSVRRSHPAQANRRSTNSATDQTVDGVRRAGRAHRSDTELLTRLQREGSNLLVEVDLALDLKREVDPAECYRRLRREPLVSLEFTPSAKPCRTAFSISRWAVTPNLLRNLRMLVLKTSSFCRLHVAACCWPAATLERETFCL